VGAAVFCEDVRQVEGLGEEYDDRPVAGLFGTLDEAQTEFLRSNQGFEAE
jgi:hypothetical protein